MVIWLIVLGSLILNESVKIINYRKIKVGVIIHPSTFVFLLVLGFFNDGFHETSHEATDFVMLYNTSLSTIGQAILSAIR